MIRNRIAPGLLMATALASMAGCTPSDPFNRQPVSGTVKYKGKSIVIGTVTIQPESSGGPTQVSLGITDGAFSVGKEKGLAPGKYLVKFNGYDRIVKGPAPGSNEPMPEPAKEVFPAKYNTASTTVIEVKSGVPNTFDFDLN